MFTSKESFSPHRFLAAALFGVLVGSGYAISTQVEGALDQEKVAIPAVPATSPDLSPAAVYFPAQYVNQAKDIKQHIEAF